MGKPICEPTHSIVQFPDQDDDGNPTQGRMDALEQTTIKEGWGAWLKKKIKDWFHFSKLGFGHSESLGRMEPLQRHRLPPNTKYEALWWVRKVKRDGPFRGPDHNSALALECATEYADRVSIGNLTLLRQFLEGSMKKSERPAAYVNQFRDMLTTEGSNTFYNKLKRLLSIKDLKTGVLYQAVKQNLDLVIKIMMSFTRKRNLLVPEWSDDQKLWIPKLILS